MTKRESVLLASACFFGGIVVGFIVAPIKGGVSCGYFSGNNNIGNTLPVVPEDESKQNNN